MPSSPMSRLWMAIAASLLGILGGLGAVGASAAVTPLLTERIQAGGTGATLTLDGTVEASQDARVAAQVGGRITSVLVKAGDAVQAGQPLLRIDATLAGQQLAASRAQQAQAEAMRRAAQADHERAQSLLSKGFISPAAFDQSQARLQAAQAGAEALRAQAQARGTQAGFHVVKAPFAGRISQLSVSEGDLASPGSPLLQLFALPGLRVAVSVPESDVARLKLSLPARIGLPHAGEQVWTAPSFTVLPGLDPITHAATLRVALPPEAVAAAARLGPGQLARVSLPLLGASAGLSVPAAALVQRGEVPAVYVVDAQGVPRLRQLRLGRSHAGRVDVVAGLKAGERVATEPLQAAQRLP